MNRITEKSKIEVMKLSEALYTTDLEEIARSIKAIISQRIKISVKYQCKKFICCSHSSIFQGEADKFTEESIITAAQCNYNHTFCIKCINYYISQNFATNKIDCSKYECFYCSYYSIPGTQLLDQTRFRTILNNLFGESTIKEIESYTHKDLPNIPLNNCGICNKNSTHLVMICFLGHQCCIPCLKVYLSNLQNNTLRCFDSSCTKDIYVKAIIDNLSDDPILYSIKVQLEAFNFYLSFCPTCKKKIDINQNQNESACKCGTSICNNCKKLSHFGLTCFYFESDNDFEYIDLSPPKIIDRPENLLEQEYLLAKYAFENFLECPGPKFKSAKLIVNKTLENRYSTKKQAMAKECNGQDKVDEVYIWHGSASANYDNIARNGLLVGGVDIRIANADVHGLGVYCSTTPDTPITYARDSKWVIACLALKGNQSPNKVTNANELNTGVYHSYKPVGDETTKNWQVIFTKEQILPRFCVEYE